MTAPFAPRVRTILTTIEATGAELPASLTAAAELHTRVTTAAGQLRGQGSEMPTTVLAALDAGRNPFEDPAVQHAAVAYQFAQINGADQVEALAVERFTEALQQHATEVVAALQVVVDTAAAAITLAAKTLGGTDPADPNAVLRLGGKAAEAWGRHQSAATQLDAVNTARGVMAQALRWSEPRRNVLALRWAALTAAQIEDHGTAEPQALVRAGITLALADGAEVQRRLRAIDAEHQVLRAAEEQRGRNQYRAFPVSI
ncbi:hypothetical protein ABLG96_13870 [Nakamurella sp. A5-74]|uniref:Uncharacterized protein n=1 Tax=Nakamurella sp. A5-74 TaxID=3158264 RepID=A0AAU8DLW3_9ACTN